MTGTRSSPSSLSRPAAHRGQRLTPRPVKTRAQQRGLRSCRRRACADPRAERMRAARREVAVVVASGQICPRAVPRRAATQASINVHALCCPRYVARPRSSGRSCAARSHHRHTRFRWTRAWTPGDATGGARLAIGPRSAGRASGRLAVIGERSSYENASRGSTSSRLSTSPARAATPAPRLKRDDGHLDWQRPGARDGQRRRG